jgi:acyl-CoA synthetase (AMP-forming)/AMP-acid ligase II/acyl carrier protein
LLSGGSVICCRERAVQELVPHLANLRPTWFSASPTLLMALLEEVERAGGTPSHHLRFLRSVTMPLASTARQRLESVFQVPVVEVYGMTEASSQVCSSRLPGPGVVNRPGTVGLPAGPEVTVLGADGEHCPPGVTGQIAIRGPNVTAGYEAADHSGWITAANGELWFLTGDEGYLDQEGRLFLAGRLKEMINRGGEKIIPRRVDEALLQHPVVDQALAFAVPHASLGEDLVAAVVLRSGGSIEEQELRRYAFSLLAPHEVPSSILFLEELPRGATGKLQRIGLAERLAHALRPSEEPALGEMEELVASVIGEMLELSPPSREANFFLLGGDSLSGTRVITRLAEHLSLDLQPTLLFITPTVRTLAERLDGLIDQALARFEEGI